MIFKIPKASKVKGNENKGEMRLLHERNHTGHRQTSQNLQRTKLKRKEWVYSGRQKPGSVGVKLSLSHLPRLELPSERMGFLAMW